MEWQPMALEKVWLKGSAEVRKRSLICSSNKWWNLNSDASNRTLDHVVSVTLQPGQRRPSPRDTRMLLFLAQRHLQAEMSALLTVYSLGPRKILLHISSSESFIQSCAWGLLGCWHRRQTLTQSMGEGRESAGAPRQAKGTKKLAKSFSQRAWRQQSLT